MDKIVQSTVTNVSKELGAHAQGQRNLARTRTESRLIKEKSNRILKGEVSNQTDSQMSAHTRASKLN